MKKMNRKGFTLIELLAVIVVLAIILVITVPMILNTLGDTRQSALQSSANATAKYIEDEIGLATLGKGQMFTVGTDLWFNSDGKVCGSGSTASTSTGCKTTGTALKLNALPNYTLLGLNDTDYDLANSTATWDDDGIVTVVLKAKANGKFAGAADATSGVK